MGLFNVSQFTRVYDTLIRRYGVALLECGLVYRLARLPAAKGGPQFESQRGTLEVLFAELNKCNPSYGV